jgi:hypothetical protein
MCVERDAGAELHFVHVQMVIFTLKVDELVCICASVCCHQSAAETEFRKAALNFKLHYAHTKWPYFLSERHTVHCCKTVTHLHNDF